MSQDVKYLDDDSFEATVGKGVFLVDFYADWCGPCRMMTPIIEELASEFKGKATIAKIDIEVAQNVTASYNVTSIPTIILFKDGQEIQRIVGVKDKEALKGMISGVL